MSEFTPEQQAKVDEIVKSRIAREKERWEKESGAECVGTSGFTTREDVLLAVASPDAEKLVKGSHA